MWTRTRSTLMFVRVRGGQLTVCTACLEAFIFRAKLVAVTVTTAVPEGWACTNLWIIIPLLLILFTKSAGVHTEFTLSWKQDNHVYVHPDTMQGNRLVWVLRQTDMPTLKTLATNLQLVHSKQAFKVFVLFVKYVIWLLHLFISSICILFL